MRILGLTSLTLLALAACSGTSTPDGGPGDGGAHDAATTDAGAGDTGTELDAGPGTDAGPVIDGGPDLDAGPMTDAGPVTDAGASDAGASDAGGASDGSASGVSVVVSATSFFADCEPGPGGPRGDPFGTVTLTVTNTSGAPVAYTITSLTLKVISGTMTSPMQDVTVDAMTGTFAAGSSMVDLTKTGGTPAIPGCGYCSGELDVTVTLDVGGTTIVASSTSDMLGCAF